MNLVILLNSSDSGVNCYSNDSGRFIDSDVNWVILVIMRNVVILVHLVILVNQVILLNPVILVNEANWGVTVILVILVNIVVLVNLVSLSY